LLDGAASPGSVGSVTQRDRVDIEPFVPSRLHLWRELGVVRDAARTLAGLSRLNRAPRGQGQPALFLPGFRTGDSATSVSRRWLQRRGFATYGWQLGVNGGDVGRLLPAITRRAEDLAAQHDGPIALVGTSLGGVLARELARERPDLVRRVVTLGSPVVGGPKYTQAGPSFARRGFDLDALELEIETRASRPIKAPITVIYSRRDGVVAWPACIDRRNPQAEHIEIESTHVGLTFHGEALRILAERLALDPPLRARTSDPAGSAPEPEARRPVSPRTA